MNPLIASLAVIVFLFSPPVLPMAFAALGGDATSIDADRAQMKGSEELKQGSTYTVHQLKGASGTVVREYISSGGSVFAVAWQGQFVPNMQQLLGTYFDQYSAAVKANKDAHAGRHPLNLQLPGLVVQMNGYTHAYHFRAYVPQQVPAGVTEEELQ
jgi:hypothetical protein